jgi:hypothetical protein
MVLMVMVTISALATALGSFFFAEDIELLLSTPAPPAAFFSARFIYVLLTVAWMPFVFIFPVLLAMGSGSQFGTSFVFMAILTLLPYFVIPTALSVIIATLTMSVIDARWTRIICLLGVVAALAGVLYTANIFETIRGRCYAW